MASAEHDGSSYVWDVWLRSGSERVCLPLTTHSVAVLQPGDGRDWVSCGVTLQGNLAAVLHPLLSGNLQDPSWSWTHKVTTSSIPLNQTASSFWSMRAHTERGTWCPVSIRTLYLYGDRLWKGQTEAIPGHAAVLACILFLYVVDLQRPVVKNSNALIDLGEKFVFAWLDRSNVTKTGRLKPNLPVGD